jgi:dTDP-3-amino-3,4,6-trideoxy-alpha-D-glucose transaminase
MVPLVDLTRRLQRYEADYVEAVRRVLRSGTVLLGDELAGFEAELAPVFGAAGAVGVSSGASALQLALAAVGVGPGDEVVVPAFTAVPTASAVCALGAVPVPVDVDVATAALDLDATSAAIRPATRAVVPVHLYGRPMDVAPFIELGVPVIEDAAQAHGAVRSVAGAAVATSFYPTKNLGGIGDGGAVLSDDSVLLAAVRRGRAHGMTEQYVHVDISQNHRLSELEAAWLRLELPRLPDDTERRRTIVRHYRDAAPELRWHEDHPDHVHHLCVVRFADREAARARLAERGVASGVHYPLAITQQPAYRRFTRAACPRAESWAAECTSIPCFPELSDSEVEAVAAALATLVDEVVV